MGLSLDDHTAVATVSMATSLWTATVVSLTGMLVMREETFGPVAPVDHAVVVTAEQDEVGQPRGAAVDPMSRMVGLAPARRPVAAPSSG